MAWETRRGHGRYYTRSRRIKGRVKREYYGSGWAGQRAAQEDEERRASQAAQRQVLHAQQERWRPLEAPLDNLDETCKTLLRAAMIRAGFHRHHRGDWRKKRG